MSVAISPVALAGWPCFVAAILVSILQPHGVIGERARWWRAFLAYVIDAGAIVLSCLIPFTVFSILVEVGHLPPPWEFSRPGSTVLDWFIFIPVFVMMWCAVALTLHPKLTSPGAFVMGIQIEPESTPSIPTLLLYGPVAYHVLAFPFLRVFGPETRAYAWNRSKSS